MALSWQQFVDVTTKIINVFGWDRNIRDPESVRNNTDSQLHFCVQREDNSYDLVTLDPGQSMTDHQGIKDVEAYVDLTGSLTKIGGKLSELTCERIYERVYCEWKLKDTPGVNDRCQIEDKDAFLDKNDNWRPCFDKLPSGPIQTEPICGVDFNVREERPEPRDDDSRDNLFDPIVLPNGLFRVGMESLTSLIKSPNFEGVSAKGWKYPVGYYNRLGYDGPEGFFNNHYMDCHRIRGTGKAPHGIYQDLRSRIKGKIRFGVHVKRTSGAEDAKISIVIWSLSKHIPSEQKYVLPLGVYFDCFTDAEVDESDVLRIEIYLPEGATYNLGGAYLLREL